MVKKLILILIVFINFLVATSQTTFMGIPVDGSKENLRPKLEAKGFTYYSEDNFGDDIYIGDFNGEKNAIVFVQTIHNKVTRVGVATQSYDETTAKIKFNNLLSQFTLNEKYLPLETNRFLTQEDDIYSLIVIHKQQINAGFYQKPFDESKFVWFMIERLKTGDYCIMIYYENFHNRYIEDEI